MRELTRTKIVEWLDKHLRNHGQRKEEIKMTYNGVIEIIHAYVETHPCEAMKVLHSLSPGGSEYVNDPERCAEAILTTRKTLMHQLVQMKQNWFK